MCKHNSVSKYKTNTLSFVKTDTGHGYRLSITITLTTYYYYD